MKFSCLIETAKEISVVLFFVTVITFPLMAWRIIVCNENLKKIEEINKKYDRKLSEIRECKTIECINKVMRSDNAVN